MKKYLNFLLFVPVFLWFSCIREEAANQEADITALVFPENSLRTHETEIHNDYVVVYPLRGVNLRDSAFRIEVSSGASWDRIESSSQSDTLFYIRVVSESLIYSKTYPVIDQASFPNIFRFENWFRPSKNYLYENPKEGPLLWYSSNNGAAIAWNNYTKPASEYLVSPFTHERSNTAVHLKTMEGPGKIAGGITFIPCLAGSLYLGGFNPLTGLSAPLRSTSFGIPFDLGKPTRLTGEYLFREGEEDYINSKGEKEKGKTDICAFYALIFKTDAEEQFLYGDNIATSPRVIARAEIKPHEIQQLSELTPFDLEFDYESYPQDFRWDELYNNEYKITIVFSSSSRGQHYEGRPGNTLIIDNVSLHYDESPEQK